MLLFLFLLVNESDGQLCYKAYIKLDGKLYYVSVTGGDQPLIYGEQVVSTLAIDKTLQEELIEKECYIKKSGV